MTKDEALDLALEALESVLANHNGAPVLPWIEARDAIKQARALDKKAENTMIYRTFEQWKSGNVLEHGVPRTEHYSEDQLDLVEMGWNYGYDAGRAVEQALDKKAENARELGLDYEPAEWLTGCPECGMDSGCDCDSGTWNPPAAPVQKPVWIRPDELQKAQKAPFLCRVEPHKRDDFVPLYTTPPAAQRQWVGLTDEEIEKACVPLGAAMLSFTEVARAIEAKLREKNT